ncbi:hypothetical protein STVIR_8051 [Streptomyces viridochromogenes Tue57]|uniref:Uncharacterized protein n=2 Tax=Streptomyces viridochromogenes TaxID=1938 RepID=L8P083_STRVR|nr:hypothetical protein STVIR_8051 [Streptomyces viridochromogenes Tue57]
MCADVEGQSTAQGASVITYFCNGGDNQKFWLLPPDKI